MIDALKNILLAAMELMQIPLTLGDFTFSFWQIFLFGIVAGAIIYLILKWVGD